MQIDFDIDIPIYIQIASQIEDSILSGAFAEEAQIPSTTEISTIYKINPATVLKGVNILASQDILYKKRGVGMFVKAGAVKKIREKHRQSFYEDYIVKLLAEAKKLDIKEKDIIRMITKGDQS